MCGVCGYVGIREDGLLEAMTDALAHRGPDDFGLFRDGDVGLGHRRLSIIDVAGGQQPIENEDSSAVLIANGEIYNHVELREELIARGHSFRTRSDSEVILHLWEDRGPACVERLNGMFAFAIWDRRERELFLARDRLGIKPLYYAALPGRLLFASELKAILRYRGFDPTPDPHAVLDYLALRYSPGPGGMFREVSKLPAGHTLRLGADGEPRVERYWKPPLATGPFTGRPRDWLEGFGERFERSVRRRLISEVPLGAYLSGGVDSGAIVGAMARLGASPLRTFTVGFDYEHDELAEAAATARAFGCEHTEIECRASDVGLLPEIVYHLDEPIGDGIVVPLYQLAREAKKHVTVILAGEGADEILGGYLFHKALLWGHWIARAVPGPLRRGLLAPLLGATPASWINLAFSYPASLGERGKQKVLDFLALLEPAQLPAAFRHLISLFDARDTPGLFTAEFEASVAAAEAPAPPRYRLDPEVPYLNRIIDLQFASWLPDVILMKHDKLSMAHGIEARVPFLDHELVEYALRVPPALRLRAFKSKAILRRYAAGLLPPRAAARRKMPFYVPVQDYFDEPVLQDMVADTLSDASLRARGILRPDAVAKLRESIHRGEMVYARQVLSLVILELWFRMAVDRRGAC